MSAPTTAELTPADVERASERDAKRYELVDGELREKRVGTRSLFIATRICDRLNALYYPGVGFAVVEAMIYCFERRTHGRKPDVSFVKFDRLEEHAIPEGDLFIAPDLVVEVLSQSNNAIDVEEKLNEYLTAGAAMVWIVNPDGRTVRLYRADGTTQLFRAEDTIQNEPLLPDFSLRVGDVFPV